MRGGLIKQHHGWLAFGQRLLDALTVFGLLPLLVWFLDVEFAREYQVAAAVGSFITWTVMGAVSAYRPWRGSGLLAEGAVIIRGWIVVLVLLFFVVWVSESAQYYPQDIIAYWLLISPVVMIVSHFSQRLFLRGLRKMGRNYRTAVIIGAGDLGKQLIHRMHNAEWMGIKVLGFFDDDLLKQGGALDGVPVLGLTSAAGRYVNEYKVDFVYLALPMRAETRIREVFDELQDGTASVYLVPDVFVFRLLDARMQELNGLPVFSLCETPLKGPFGAIKRMEDLLLAVAILILIAPVLFLIAIGVKATSPGSILFKQRRYGLNGETVVIWKFRTMSVMEDGELVTQTQRIDPRVTPFGRFLRSTSLDELPQFFNVIQGRMSIVGPRPHAVAHNEQYRKLITGYMWRHKVKPGITGWAQINGWRGETDTLEKMEKRVEHDLAYIQNWSVWLDLKIIFLTLWRGFKGKNAY